MDSQAFLGAFLSGTVEPPPDSWVFRENWLVWHSVLATPAMLEEEIAKVVARASGEKAMPWAWESLRRLYNDCREAGEPLPEPLQAWVDDVVNERLQRPTPRGAKPDSYRNSRYRIAYAFLTEFLQRTKELAIADMARATNQPEETVRSILRRS